MSLSGIFAQVVALVGDAAILWRRLQGSVHQQAVGQPRRRSRRQGRKAASRRSKMPTAKGWAAGADAGRGAGLKVNAFATGLKHPRWIQRAAQWRCTGRRVPDQLAGAIRTAFDYAMFATMKRAAAVGTKAPTASLWLRDADGDGVAETRETFLERLNQPFGMALLGDTFYVGNTDGVVAFPYVAGTSRITGRGESSPSSSLAGIGRGACCRAPTG